MQYPVFQKRAALSASDLNLAMDALKRARILPGVGIKLTETLNGTVVSLKPTRGGGGSVGTERRPWEITNLRGVGEPDEDGKYSTYEFQIWPGTISGLLPVNLFDGDELRWFTASAGAAQNVLLKCTSDGNELTTATIEVSASFPAPQPAVKFGVPSELNILLAVVYGAAAYQVESENMSAQPQMVYIKEKASPAAGEYPYEVYLNWVYHGYQGVGGGGGEAWPFPY